MADQQPPATAGNWRCPGWIAADSLPAAAGAGESAAARWSGTPGGIWRGPNRPTWGTRGGLCRLSHSDVGSEIVHVPMLNKLRVDHFWYYGTISCRGQITFRQHFPSIPLYDFYAQLSIDLDAFLHARRKELYIQPKDCPFLWVKSFG